MKREKKRTTNDFDKNNKKVSVVKNFLKSKGYAYHFPFFKKKKASDSFTLRENKINLFSFISTKKYLMPRQ